MGFYIHSCPKMRYKAQYLPSEIVCPETLVWIPVEKCLPILDKAKYSRLNDSDAATSQLEIDLDNVGVLYRREAMQVIIDTFLFYLWNTDLVTALSPSPNPLKNICIFFAKLVLSREQSFYLMVFSPKNFRQTFVLNEDSSKCPFFPAKNTGLETGCKPVLLLL